jgi:hypothetical protein
MYKNFKNVSKGGIMQQQGQGLPLQLPALPPHVPAGQPDTAEASAPP